MWLLRHQGVLSTRAATRPLQSAGAGLGRWAAYLPVAECSDSAAELLRLRRDIEGLTPENGPSSSARPSSRRERGDRTLLCAGRVDSSDAPETVECRVGGGGSFVRRPKSSSCTGRASTVQLTRDGTPVIFVENEEDADALAQLWGMKPHETAIVARDRRRFRRASRPR